MTDDGEQGSDRDQQLRRRVGRFEAATEAILYQHSILCQTGLPYRNPGDDVRSWEQRNGAARLEISAGKAMHPELGELVPLGLPYGPKPRLILAHLNSEALRQRSPEIEVEASLTAFVKRLQLDTGGRTIGTIKDQFARLAASSITLGLIRDGRAITVNSRIVAAFDLWFPKEEGGRVLWPHLLRLSPEYFDSLARHAVPLHDRALMALSGSAMGLDVYAWLAQRLHRIEWGERVLVPWGTAARLGVRRRSPLAGMGRWLAGISVRSRNRACHYRRRSEPGAGDRPRVATSASAVTCSSGGSPGNWPSLR